MLVSDFNFELPKELIAQFPAEKRDGSRMMILERETGRHAISDFSHFSEYLSEGDCLVLNDTKVIPARLWGHRPESGGKVQVFMLESRGDSTWQVFLKPGRRLQIGSQVSIDGSDATITVLEKEADGACLVKFNVEDVLSLLEQCGSTPLPPYINRAPDASDRERYQTVYAVNPGSVACPTAGLHITKEILATLEARGIRVARLTLHVGAGTFKPVEEDTVEKHVMHEERYTLSEDAARIINDTHANGKRVFCIGTTSVRTLETCAIPGTNRVMPGSGRTSIFLYPPKKPQIADGLLTNFHLPQSTLLMLVCCFAPYDAVMETYRDAVANRFRFFSYGDCMLLLPPGQAAIPAHNI